MHISTASKPQATAGPAVVAALLQLVATALQRLMPPPPSFAVVVGGASDVATSPARGAASSTDAVATGSKVEEEETGHTAPYPRLCEAASACARVAFATGPAATPAAGEARGPAAPSPVAASRRRAHRAALRLFPRALAQGAARGWLDVEECIIAADNVARALAAGCVLCTASGPVV